MFKKLASILTITFLFSTGISVASAPLANAYASNAGANNAEVQYQITVDGNGSFTVPANTKRVSANLNFQLSNQNAATFSNQTFAVIFNLKNPNGDVITQTLASALSPTASFYSNVSWTATQLNGYLANTPVTLNANNTTLNGYVGASLEFFDGSYVPAGSYQYELSILKAGSAYSLANDDTLNKYAYVTLGGNSFTNPSNILNTSLTRLSVATCVNRELVTSSDTLTLHPSVTTTGTSPTPETRFFQGAALGQSNLLSNTSTLALTSVDLTKPISVGMIATLDNTAGVVSSADLSVTRGDGTEVTQSCTPPTPSAPTVSIVSETTLRATFTLSSSSSYPNCFLYLASDLNTVIRRTGAMPVNRVANCNFPGRTAGVEYVVKVQEFFDFYYSEVSQQSSNFSIYRGFSSSLSQASTTITTAGAQSSQNAQSAEQLARAAAIEAERVRQENIAKSKVVLIDLLENSKLGTLEQYRNADLPVASIGALERVNTKILALPLGERTKFESMQKIVTIENFVDLASNAITQKKISAKDVVAAGLLPVESSYKATIAIALRKKDPTTLVTIEKIADVVEAELALIKARQDRTAAIKAKIAARNK